MPDEAHDGRDVALKQEVIFVGMVDHPKQSFY